MTGKRRVRTALILDDEEIDQFLARRIIRRTGLFDEIFCFHYPHDALNFLKTSDRPEIDVIFLDINLPRINGFEFIEQAEAELGSSFTKIVVIMLTTSLDPADFELAKSFSVVKDFQNKPLTVDSVGQVEKLLQAIC